ncbi:MAG: PaaI family thioesterase [Bacillota bacterium]
MSRLNEQLMQEKMEKDITEIIDHIQSGPERINMVMNPKLIACNAKEQSIVIEFPVLEWQLNPYDKMHGGLIATAFDETFGIFAFYLANRKSVVSVNISLNFQKPVPMNDSILITAKATSLGKRIITISGECHLRSNGLLTNTAIGTFAVV